MRVRIVTVLLGVWLIVCPSILGYGGGALTVDRIAGPVVVFFGMLALRDVTRIFRLFNVLPGLWVLVSPWILGLAGWQVIVNHEFVGLAIMALALIPGTVRQRTGGGWLALWPPDRISPEEYVHPISR